MAGSEMGEVINRKRMWLDAIDVVDRWMVGLRTARWPGRTGRGG